MAEKEPKLTTDIAESKEMVSRETRELDVDILQVGAGSKAIRISRDGLYAGAEKFADAPFSVTPEGTVRGAGSVGLSFYQKNLTGNNTTTITGLSGKPRRVTLHGYIENTTTGKYGITNGTAERNTATHGFFSTMFTDGSLYTFGNKLCADSASNNVTGDVTAWTDTGLTIQFNVATNWHLNCYFIVES